MGGGGKKNEWWPAVRPQGRTKKLSDDGGEKKKPQKSPTVEMKLKGTRGAAPKR